MAIYALFRAVFYGADDVAFKCGGFSAKLLLFMIVNRRVEHWLRKV